MKVKSKHRANPENALQADFRHVNSPKVLPDQKGAEIPANLILWANRPISEAEQTLVSGYSQQVQAMFSRYFYLLRSDRGLMWATGNPELAAFVRALWTLNSEAFQAVAA